MSRDGKHLLFWIPQASQFKSRSNAKEVKKQLAAAPMGSLSVYDRSTQKLVQTLPLLGAYPSGARFTFDPKHIVYVRIGIAPAESELRLWDLSSRSDRAFCEQFEPNSEYGGLHTLNSGAAIFVRRSATSAMLHVAKYPDCRLVGTATMHPADPNARAGSVAISADGSRIAYEALVAMRKGSRLEYLRKLIVRSLTSLELIHELAVDEGSLYSDLTFSLDGTVLAGACVRYSEGKARSSLNLFDAFSGKVLRSADIGGALRVALSRDGKYIATATRAERSGLFGKQVQAQFGIYELNSMRLVTQGSYPWVNERHYDPWVADTHALFFGPDDAELITSSHDTRIWGLTRN